MNPWALLGGLVALLLAAGGGYIKGQHDEAADQIEVQRNGLLAYAGKIKEGVEQHDKDIAIISGLRHELNGVQVHFPTYPTACDPDGKARILSGRVDELFARLQERTSNLIERCDKLNIDSIRANTLIK